MVWGNDCFMFNILNIHLRCDLVHWKHQTEHEQQLSAVRTGTGHLGRKTNEMDDFNLYFLVLREDTDWDEWEAACKCDFNNFKKQNAGVKSRQTRVRAGKHTKARMNGFISASLAHDHGVHELINR